MDKKFDLNDRTLDFSLKVLDFVGSLPALRKGPAHDIVMVQLARAATSIGANYREADCAESRKDFEHKIGICKKEANEARYWLEIMRKSFSNDDSEIVDLENEADELKKIFVAIIKKSRNNRLNV